MLFISVCYDCENPDLPKIDGYYVIQNKQAPTIIKDRALLTLPEGFSIRKSTFPNAGLGVFAETTIPKGTRIGPFDGLMYSIRCKNCVKRYTWAVRDEDTLSVKHYIDAQSKDHSSWLRYVNCANTVDQENVFYYQHNYEVYHVTYECIKPGTELSIWYGTRYGKLLGLNRTSDDYMKRFNETDKRALIHNSLSYGESGKLLNHCYRFVKQTPINLSGETKLCRHWKAYIICRYYDCDVNPCTGRRDCGGCQGYCLHVGQYYKSGQVFIGGDNVSKCSCRKDGNVDCMHEQSTFVDMCIFH